MVCYIHCGWFYQMSAVSILTLIAFSNVCLNVCVRRVGIDRSSLNKVSVGASGAFRFPLPHSVNEYLPPWSSSLNARRLGILTEGLTSIVTVANGEYETAYGSWRRRWINAAGVTMQMTIPIPVSWLCPSCNRLRSYRTKRAGIVDEENLREQCDLDAYQPYPAVRQWPWKENCSRQVTGTGLVILTYRFSCGIILGTV